MFVDKEDAFRVGECNGVLNGVSLGDVMLKIAIGVLCSFAACLSNNGDVGSVKTGEFGLDFLRIFNNPLFVFEEPKLGIDVADTELAEAFNNPLIALVVMVFSAKTEGTDVVLLLFVKECNLWIERALEVEELRIGVILCNEDKGVKGGTDEV